MELLGGELSEVVRDSQLDVEFGPGYTLHPQETATRRGNHRYEKWIQQQNPIGKGGMGSVYVEARECPGSGRAFMRAVKKIDLSENLEQKKMVRRELEALFKFSQPIFKGLFIQPYGWFIRDQCVHIAMEFYEMGDLQKYIENSTKCPGGRLPENEVACIASQILDALYLMHKHNFSHWDLKPANLLIKQQPQNPWIIKLGDFGISKRGEALTQFTSFAGTPDYMPPEFHGYQAQSGAQNSRAVDMWCLGQTLYRLMTGQSMFLNGKERHMFFGGQSSFPNSILQSLDISTEGINFLRRLIVVNPEARISAEVASQDPWIEKYDQQNDRVQDTGFDSHQGFSGHILGTFSHESVLSFTASARWTTDFSPKYPSSPTTFPAGMLPTYAPHGHSHPEHQAQYSTTLTGDTLDAWYELGVTLLQDKDTRNEGRHIFRGLIAEIKKVRGDEYDDVIDMMCQLAKSFAAEQNWAEARALWREVVDLRRRLSGVTDKRTMASVSELAWALGKCGQYEQQQTMLRDLLTLMEKSPGSGHSNTLEIMYDLAKSLAENGKEVEAESLFYKALQGYELEGRFLIMKSNIKQAIARIMSSQKRHNQAGSFYRSSWSLRRDATSDNDETTIAFMVAYGINLGIAQKEFDRAEPILQEAFQLHNKVLGEDHQKTLSAMYAYIIVLQRRGKYKEALSIARETLERQNSFKYGLSPGIYTAISTLGWLYYKTKQYPDAESMYGRLYMLLKVHLGHTNATTLETLHMLAKVRGGRGDFSGAISHASKAARLRKKHLSDDSWMDSRALEEKYRRLRGAQTKKTQTLAPPH